MEKTCSDLGLPTPPPPPNGADVELWRIDRCHTIELQRRRGRAAFAPQLNERHLSDAHALDVASKGRDGRRGDATVPAPAPASPSALARYVRPVRAVGRDRGSTLTLQHRAPLSPPLSCAPCRPTDLPWRVVYVVCSCGGPSRRASPLYPRRARVFLLRPLVPRGPCVGGVTGHGSRISGVGVVVLRYIQLSSSSSSSSSPSSVQSSSFEGGKNKVVSGARASEVVRAAEEASASCGQQNQSSRADTT